MDIKGRTYTSLTFYHSNFCCRWVISRHLILFFLWKQRRRFHLYPKSKQTLYFFFFKVVVSLSIETFFFDTQSFKPLFFVMVVNFYLPISEILLSCSLSLFLVLSSFLSLYLWFWFFNLYTDNPKGFLLCLYILVSLLSMWWT